MDQRFGGESQLRNDSVSPRPPARGGAVFGGLGGNASIGDPAWIERDAGPVYAVIAGVTISVFIADLLTQLGIAVWILYLIPIIVSFVLWHPLMPLSLAGAATGLMVLGFFMSPAGVDAHFGLVNRIFGGITAWTMGAAGYLFISGKRAVRRQEWFQAGQVGLAERMGGELTLPQLGDNVLRYLAEHLGAQAAAIYIRDGHSFRRSATYAVPDGCGIPDEIGLGDGLLGQALKDGRGFVLRDVPDGYLSYGSALGRDRPRHLLVVPVKADGDVNAAIELGFAGEIGETHMEMVERVSQAIGTAVRSSTYRARLQELLEETRRQAEELQKQSEELRASNEELEEQSRVLEASQARLEQQQTELERTNAELEEQTSLLEAQRSDLERSQAALQSQASALEQASRYKSEFLANMSHELRTPLNSSLIMARLLADNRDGNLTSEQVRYAETIETSGNDLLTLINDILDLSKVEAGRVDVHVEPIGVARLVDKLARTFQPVAQQRGLGFRTDIAVGTPELVETDPQRIEQVLKNFLSNALKFTESGEVALAVGTAPDGRVAFSVRDTGIGIKPEQRQIIFEAFRQADGTTNRKYGGTGLGLSISRELSRLLGGEILLDSEVGRGSTFTLLLPPVYDHALVRPRAEQLAGGGAAPVQAEGVVFPPVVSHNPAPPAPVARLHRIEDDRETLTGDSRIILVVEDDPSFARILYVIAREQGFQCLIAETADEGVAMARQYLPHAVILDIELPDHTGLSVLDRLKHNVRTRHIPVHVVSGHDYTQAALSLGAIGYLLKPAKREQLVEALQHLEQRLDRKVRRILVVEDDASQLEGMRLLLASSGVETVGAASAAECLRHLEERTFDCMVLDLSLPDISGFDLLDELSRDEERAFPPVIVYTGRDLSSDEELRLRRYSKSIIVKGAKSPERLLDEITLFLHQVVSDLPGEQQRVLTQALNRDSALEGRRILVVEDDVRNIFAVTSIFEPQGSVVQIARNGREALDALERSKSAGQRIDLVLMDVMMPEMDGLTATRKIRERPEWKGLPIIALTAKAMPDDQEQCLAAGANDYMAKPLNVEKLLSLVRVWMPR